MNNQTVLYFIQIIKNTEFLKSKEKSILIDRLKGKNLETIGKKFKLSGERIRQIEESSLLKFLKSIKQLVLFKEV
jgi:DNA-directed RNA polymerase sigma subunit (sigma70/sigma32)